MNQSKKGIAKEKKRLKAKNLRYKKPIVKDINFDKMTEDLWYIMEKCEDIRWYTDSDDGEDSLLNALDGDEDEAYEFKMAFADLCAECERMRDDLQEEWVPECFDIFFVAAGAGESYGGLLGWDSFECDYFGIDSTVMMINLAGKSVFVKTQEEYLSVLKMAKLQGFTWARGNHLNPIKIPFPNILNFCDSKIVTYSYTEKTLYEASKIIEDEEKIKDAVNLVRAFTKRTDGTAFTDSFIQSLELLADTVESQMEEVK